MRRSKHASSTDATRPEHYVAHDVVPAEWEIVGGTDLEHAGNARPDLIVIDADGYAPWIIK